MNEAEETWEDDSKFKVTFDGKKTVTVYDKKTKTYNSWLRNSKEFSDFLNKNYQTPY